MELPRTPRCLLAAFLWLFPVVLLAHPDVEAGKEAYQKGEFRDALVKLDQALRSPSATEDDQIEAYWYKGRSYFAMGKGKQADKQFDEVLALSPLYTPDKLRTPPDLREAFNKRAELYQKKHGVTVGEPVMTAADIVTTLGGNVEVAATVAVFARSAGEKNYRPFDFPVVDGGAKGMLSNLELWELSGASGKMELVLEVRNARGRAVARLGDALEPHVLPVSKAQADEAVAAVKATLPPPEPEPVAQSTQGAAPQEGEGGGPSPMMAVGGAMIVAGVLLGLAALAFNVGTGGLWGGVGAAYYQAANVYGIEKRPDKPVLDLVIYWGSRAGAVLLLGIAPPVTVVGLLGVLSGLLGVVVLAVSR